MLDQPIAVLGGGNAGHCMAADLSLAGYKVNFYEHPKFEDAFRATLRTGLVDLRTNWTDQWRTAKIHKVTTDIKDALADAKLVNVVVPAIGHELFFDTAIPYLRNGQVVVIYPDNYGSLRLRQLLKERRPSLEITIYGTTTMPYGTRLVGPGKVSYAFGYGPSMRGENAPFEYDLRTAALPATETGIALEYLQELWAGLEVAHNVLSVCLSNINIVLHPLSSLLNAGSIEYSKGDFYLYRDGMTPSVLRASGCLLDEIVAVGRAYGCEVWPFGGVSFEGMFGPITGDNSVELFAKFKGPENLQSRYFTEDIPYGLFGASQLAKKADLETPIIDATIVLGSLVSQIDIRKSGRTLSSIGLAELNKGEIISFVQGR